MAPPLILGSESSRRKEILSFFSLPFIQIPSHFDETSVHFLGDPYQYAQSLATRKGEVLAQQFPDAVVLTADTVVYFNEKIYNKPVNKEQAHAMLRNLAGNWHSVITAVSVRSSSKS